MGGLALFTSSVYGERLGLTAELVVSRQVDGRAAQGHRNARSWLPCHRTKLLARNGVVPFPLLTTLCLLTPLCLSHAPLHVFLLYLVSTLSAPTSTLLPTLQTKPNDLRSICICINICINIYLPRPVLQREYLHVLSYLLALY